MIEILKCSNKTIILIHTRLFDASNKLKTRKNTRRESWNEMQRNI